MCIRDRPETPLPAETATIAAFGSISPPERVIIEYYCEADSLMGHSKYTKNGCTIVRLTADDDVNSVTGKQKALGAIKGANTHLWIAIPCTGGSPWMKVLASHPNGRKKIKARKRVFRGLWRSLQPLAEKVYQVGGAMTIRWPKNCAYWKLRDVQAFNVKYGLMPAIF